MKVTLDTNCIIALEENRTEAHFLRQIISLHNNKVINLQISASSASERKKDKTPPTSFNDFEQKLAAVGLAHIEILPTLAYAGMAFANGKYYPTGGEVAIFERKIYSAIFPNTTFDFDSLPWNKRCDILALWSHIDSNGDIFVTADNEFLDNKKKLIALGAKEILNPKDTVHFIMSKTKN